MDKNRFIQVYRPYFLVLGQLLILIVCVSFIEFFYYTNISPDKDVKETYQQTACTIVQKSLSEKGTLLHGYRADFVVSYAANGNQYQGFATGNGLDHAYTSNQTSQETLLSQFEVGQDYPCWYNPLHPEMIVLVLRHSWTSTFPLLIPSAIGLIVLYYLSQSLFVALGRARIKVREIKKRKK